MGIFKKIIAMRRRNKIIIVIIIFLVFFFFSKSRPKPVELKFANVQRNNIESLVSASGSLNGKTSVNLHFNSAGKLNYLAANNDDSVTKGQILATIDNTTQSIA